MRVDRRSLVYAATIVAAVTCTVGVTAVRPPGTEGATVRPAEAGCTAQDGDGTALLSAAQARNASTIVSVAVRRALPRRAATIALAAAMQESDLLDIDHGDRDSLGLFQQRPSMGWGSSDQVMDPVYASEAFYDALVQVPDYTDLDVGDAAQAVEQSAYPDAYAPHVDQARIVAEALTGNHPATFACVTSDTDRNSPGPVGAAEALRAVYGERVDARTTSDSPDVVEVSFPGPDTAVEHLRWAAANWLVAHADTLDIATVQVGELSWDAQRARSGWVRTAAPSAADSLRFTVRTTE